MNVVEALTNHHTTLRQLYQRAETNPEVFDEFIHHLVVHHTMEEKYFYDLLQGFNQAEHDALEAVNEHHIIEMIIKDAEGFPRDHVHFPIKIEGLGEYTVHHLDEEEEEIFPLAQQLFTPEDLVTLGKLFEEAKDKLLSVSLPELPKSLAAKFAEQSKEEGGVKVVKTDTATSSTAIGLGIGKI
ncbi:MAG: hemerythrin domain-containing protein [Desulfocapsaceae bacterium]|nr:hemerythrin domain-containing protein [Desulfocapsaceae bacterium]